MKQLLLPGVKLPKPEVDFTKLDLKEVELTAVSHYIKKHPEAINEATKKEQK